MLTKRNSHTLAGESRTLEIRIQGMNVRLVFAAEQNVEAPALVRDILKSGWLRRKTA